MTDLNPRAVDCMFYTTKKERLQNRVLLRSESDNWDDARNEWEMVERSTSEVHVKTVAHFKCLCHQHNLTHWFCLENVMADKVISSGVRVSPTSIGVTWRNKKNICSAANYRECATKDFFVQTVITNAVVRVEG